MKTIKLKFIALAIITFALTSCNKMLFTSLDILRPAKVAFAPEASNLLLVNNSVIQPSDLGHRNILFNNSPKKISLNTDSLSIYCLGALTEELESKDFFTSVKLIPNSVNKTNNFNKIRLLRDSTIKELCLDNTANTILSLNSIRVNDDLNEYYFPESGLWLAALEFRIETQWSVHYLNSPEVTSVQFKDTVYWESESYNRRNAVAGLPKRSDALVDAALNVGHKSGNKFVPYWEKADRYFFNPRNKYMKLGMDSVYVKNWTSAINSWDKALNTSKSTTLQAKAANNIAIAYEILGNIDKALEYATLSYNLLGKITFPDMEAYIRAGEYVKILSQRKKEIAILKKQLGE